MGANEGISDCSMYEACTIYCRLPLQAYVACLKLYGIVLYD